MIIEGKQKALALAAHISYLFFGVGYILVPLALYLFYDNKDAFIAGHAKQALMVQAIYGVISAIVAGLSFLIVGPSAFPSSFLFLSVDGFPYPSLILPLFINKKGK